MSRIRTWRVGEVGAEGTRRVLEGGKIKIGGKLADGTMAYRFYSSPRLLTLVEEIVKFQDHDYTDGRLVVFECEFEPGRHKERLIVGKWLCYAMPERTAS